jgi:C1A family cysteine protease
MNILKFLKKLLGIKPKPQPKKFNFGWKRDLPDHRDIKFKIVAPHELPAKIDLRSQMPPVYNQGELGSCTANALGAAFQFEQMKQGKQSFIPSRLFIYYNEREMEGTINEDTGAMIRDGIKTMVKDGVCPETMWQYIISKFTVKPSADCYEEALKNQVLQYFRISPHTLYEVKHCLADGYPVVFGFMIYESMMTTEVSRTGIVPIPNKRETPIGGHAVMAVGYDDSRECLIVRNSWGADWGIGGYFYLPYWFITTPNAAADFWTIRLVESENQ